MHCRETMALRTATCSCCLPVSVQASPDGRFVAVGDESNTVSMYSVESGLPEKELGRFTLAARQVLNVLHFHVVCTTRRHTIGTGGVQRDGPLFRNVQVATHRSIQRPRPMGRYGHLAIYSPFCDSDDGSIRIVNVHDGVSVMNVKETNGEVRRTDCRRATAQTVVPACAA